MLSLLKHLIWIWMLSCSLVSGGRTTTIKVFHVFESFGTETQEIKNSIVMKYDTEGFLTDSTIYSHSLPLSEKYIYVLGPHEGLKLQRNYDREMVLSYHFEHNKFGNRVSTTLFGTGDTLYWKEFQKYDDRGNCIKRIRYNPIEAVNPEMMPIKDEPGKMIWGESYNYDSTGTVLEHKELYNNYVLVITTYDLGSLNIPKKRGEYFDPSVMLQTIFFHNDVGQLTHEVSVGRLGQSMGSKAYEYDILGRKIKTIVYNENGMIEETLNTVYDDDNFKTYDYYSDSTLKLASMREVLLDNQGRTYIEAILDGEERVLEKNVYYYDKKDRIAQIKQYDMIRRGRHDDREIPIRVNTYEYE